MANQGADPTANSGLAGKIDRTLRSKPTPKSRMSNNQQRPSMPLNTRHHGEPIFGIEGPQTFVEHDNSGALKQSSRDEHPAPFTVRQLPAGVPHHLVDT